MAFAPCRYVVQGTSLIFLRGCVLTTTTTTLASLVTTLAGTATTILSTIVEICSTIVDTPFLLFTCIFLFVGGCVGIIGRLLSRN